MRNGPFCWRILTISGKTSDSCTKLNISNRTNVEAISVDDLCFEIHDHDDNKMTFDSAKNKCTSHESGHLAILDHLCQIESIKNLGQVRQTAI